jgi:hypothetical protein
MWSFVSVHVFFMERMIASWAATLYESIYALQHLEPLRKCSNLIANPPAPLSSYEQMVIRDEESVSWKLWLGSFGMYVVTHQGLSRSKMFRNRLFVPQFIAILPALTAILAGGALFRQRTLERLANPPPAAETESVLKDSIRNLYEFP